MDDNFQRKYNEKLTHIENMLFNSRIRLCYRFAESKNGKCDGVRHNLMFVFISAAVPLYGEEEAYIQAKRISSKFVDGSGIKHPIVSDEIKSMINRFLKVKYKITNEKVCSLFEISKKEYELLALSNKRFETRANQKKHNKELREQRNKIIIEAIESGKKRKEAAHIADCSISMVDKVLADYRAKKNCF